MKFTLTVDSYNQKTGGIPVSTSSPDTCPDSCPFRNNGCYGDSGPMRFHWGKVGSGERGISWEEFCVAVAKLPEGQLWRHNQAGDLPGTGNDIDREMMSVLIHANHMKKGYTYTHKTSGDHNLDIIRTCNDSQFTVNMSANNIDHADMLFSVNCGPVVIVLPSWEVRKEFKSKCGNNIKMCPAIYNDTTCEKCRWCHLSRRDFIIGVPAHGSDYAKINYACGYIRRLW